ncbi:MAG: N-acetylmuramoyl-L-alanine amidase [Robiginitomaculum sp.]
MKVTDAPSPNHDERKLPISLVVLHYTGMKSGAAALAHMQSKKGGVCAHYMVAEDGEIFQLAQENARAWHAGVSSWHGVTDINSASIGIEIVNGGHDFGLPDFSSAQIKAVIELCKDIKARYNLPDKAFIGHSDIVPERKQDPGEKFPWEVLANHGIGNWPIVETNDRRILFEKGASGKGVVIVQRGFANLGYNVAATGEFDIQTHYVCTAFQRRYRPDKVDGNMDVQTMEILKLLVAYQNKERSTVAAG